MKGIVKRGNVQTWREKGEGKVGGTKVLGEISRRSQDGESRIRRS